MQLVFLLLTITNFSLGTGVEVPSNFTQIPPNILNQFHDYDLIIHFNNRAVDYVENIFLTKDVDYQTTYLINYDLKHDKLLWRPEGYKFINIVLLENPYDFKSYSTKVYNFHQYDFVLFITKEIQKEQIWKIAGLQRASAVLIYVTSIGRIFHCCYYCGKATAVLKETKTSNLRQLLNDYSDFNGHIFKIAFANYKPFFWRKPGEKKPRGAEGKFFHEFSRVHNFSYHLVEYHSKPGKGAWQAMIEAVERNHVDWAVGGLSMTIKRGIYTDFTRYIKTQGFAIMYAVYQNKWTAFESFLLAFGWFIWISIIASTVAICLVAKVASDQAGLKMTFWEYGRVVLLSIVEQSASSQQMKLFKLSFIRGIFLIWWLSSLSLTSVYKSQLASCLIRPSYNQPNKIEDLVEMDFRFRVDGDDWSVLKEKLKTSSDINYAKILTNVINDFDFCQSVFALDTQKLAIINEEITLQYDIFKRCKTVTSDYRSKLRLVTENMFSGTYHAWSMTMGTPFRLKFSKTIGRMDDYGLIDHWYKSASFYKLPRSNSRLEGRQAVALNITHFLPPFIVLGLGLATSFVVFLLELYFRSKKLK